MMINTTLLSQYGVDNFINSNRDWLLDSLYITITSLNGKTENQGLHHQN